MPLAAPTLLLLLLMFMPTIAGADSTDKRWQALRKGAASIRTLEAEFKQLKRLKILRKPLVSRGRFLFKAPSSVRWEYSAPIRTLSLVHRGKVRRYTWTSDGKAVADSAGSVEAMRTVLEQISGWLAGRFDADGVFIARLAPGETLVVVMTPREKELERFIKRVELRFADKAGVVKSVRIVESARAETEILFTDVKVNGKIPDSRFKELK